MTYLTSAEASLYCPDTDYGADLKAQSLTDSAGLVNSYLNSSVSVPIYEPSGNIPAALKIIQSIFYRYLLQVSNIGLSDENIALLSQGIELCKSITANELTLPGIQQTSFSIGWHISETSIVSGMVFVQGVPPIVYNELTFTITSTGTNDIYNTTMSVYRSDNPDTLFATITGSTFTSYNWYALPNTNLMLLFSGLFTKDEVFKVVGVADTANTITSKPVLKQSDILYCN